MSEEKPYIIEYEVITHLKYNPNYGDDRICEYLNLDLIESLQIFQVEMALLYQQG